MYGSKLITVTLAVLAACVSCAPTTPAPKRSLLAGGGRNGVSTHQSKRQEELDIAEAILDIVNDVFDLVSDIDDAQHAQEEAFTQNTVDYLIGQYPTWNVLVFHDQDSSFQYVNGYHQHVELPLTDSLGTMGYEVWVFESGTFELAGDGGYENWCFNGDYDRTSDTDVTFYSMQG